MVGWGGDHHHLVTLMQTQQVGFRVTDGAEGMIWAVKGLLSEGDNRILMPGDISNAYGSIDRLACSTTGSAVCLTIREKRNENGDPRKREAKRKT